MTEKINTRAHQLVAQSKHPLSTGVNDTWIRSPKCASTYHSRQTTYAKFYIRIQIIYKQMYLRNERTKASTVYTRHVSAMNNYRKSQTFQKQTILCNARLRIKMASRLCSGGNENWLTSELVVRKGNNVKSWKKERYYIIFSFDKCEFTQVI